MKIYGADMNGIEGRLINFEATRDKNRSGVTLLGLAGKVVREGLLRAAKAIETLEGGWGAILDETGYTIQMKPSEKPKISPCLDLPLAIMILYASILRNEDSLTEGINKLEEKLQLNKTEKEKIKICNQISKLGEERERSQKYKNKLRNNPHTYLLLGTLCISDGSLNATEYGMLGMIAAAQPGFIVIVPDESELHGYIAKQAKKIDIDVYKAKNLQEVWHLILGVKKPRKVTKTPHNKIKLHEHKDTDINLKNINGVSLGKLAVTVALAGGHNVLFVGPPGHGKTMLAEAASSLMPNLSNDEVFEVNKIISAKGELDANELVMKRPFQKVTANTTDTALLGGGRQIIVPGLISLAHRGILFVDEINIFKPSLIETLRCPLEEKKYKVTRLQQSIEYPCDFILIAAMNPCKCGWLNHYICPNCNSIYSKNKINCSKKQCSDFKLIKRCNCSSTNIKSANNISKPILDRIDLKVLISAYDKEPNSYTYASTSIKSNIKEAREKQAKRYEKAYFGHLNASVRDEAQYNEYCTGLSPEINRLRKKLTRDNNLEPRREVKLLLVAQTLADLDNVDKIRKKDIDRATLLMGINVEYFKNNGNF